MKKTCILWVIIFIWNITYVILWVILVLPTVFNNLTDYIMVWEGMGYFFSISRLIVSFIYF